MKATDTECNLAAGKWYGLTPFAYTFEGRTPLQLHSPVDGYSGNSYKPVIAPAKLLLLRVSTVMNHDKISETALEDFNARCVRAAATLETWNPC